MASGPDTIVIGAGIVGICCALSLAERGIAVHLIDRDAPGQGASYGNAGVISPWSIVPTSMPDLWRQLPALVLRSDGPVSLRLSHLPKFLPWALRFMRNGTPTRVREISAAMEVLNANSIELYRRHLAGTGHEALVQDCWYLHAYRDAKAANLNGRGYQLQQQAGAEMEKIGAQALRTLEPALSPDFKAAIAIKGQARALAPGQIGEVLARKARQMGVRITQAEITHLAPHDDGQWTVTTADTEYTAARVVMAAGAWSARLLAPLGVEVPLEAERGYHVQFASPGVTLNNSVMDVGGKFVASSMTDGVRVAGTAEFAGLDAPPNPKRAQGLIRQAKAMMPDLDTTKAQVWSGVRPSLPDSLPVIGPFDGLPGLFGAFGHAHFGLMMAPKTGECIADLFTDTRGNADLTPFGADRF